MWSPRNPVPPVTSARATARNRRAVGRRGGCLTFTSIVAAKVKHAALEGPLDPDLTQFAAIRSSQFERCLLGPRARLVLSASAPAGFRPSHRGGRRQLGGCRSSSVTGRGPSHPWGAVLMPAGLGPPMVRRVVARRLHPDRRPSWADVLTHSQWKALRPD